MMGTLRSETNRRRAGSFYQSGSLAFGAVAVLVLVSLAGRLQLGALGWIVAAMIFAAIALRPGRAAQSMISEHTPRETARAASGSEFKSTFLRWEAIPYTLLVTAPMCSGAMIGLLPALAARLRRHRPAGGVDQRTGRRAAHRGRRARRHAHPCPRARAHCLPAGRPGQCRHARHPGSRPPGPAVYFTGTVLFLFTIGACYALFTAVALEFLGGSGKSGSARYSIINSLGNLPVAYMSYLDGRGYAHWGPRAMPAADAILSAAAAALLLAHFAFNGRRPVQKLISRKLISQKLIRLIRCILATCVRHGAYKAADQLTAAAVPTWPAPTPGASGSRRGLPY